MAQKTSLEVLELSARNTKLAKRNKHHHHLGLGGYYAKEEQFKKMDEEAVAFGNIDVKNLKVRLRNWIYARSTESSGGNLKFDKRDELSLGLGNNEHTGRTRRLGKRTTWKHEF